MQLGYLTVPFVDRPLSDALDFAVKLGLETVEIPAGGFFPTTHLNAEALLHDRRSLTQLLGDVQSRGLEISALAIHGNPLHPNEEVRSRYFAQYKAACTVAESLGVRRLTLLAGLPGAGPESSHPNWITFPFPEEMQIALRWQWEVMAIPYWEQASRIAADRGVTLCFEMVPGDIVYNPRSFVKLKSSLDVEVMCNLDPSHFFHQGIDPLLAIERLAGVIGHVHAKDAWINDPVANVDGLLDTADLDQVALRGWAYRTIGTGHPASFWHQFLLALKRAGYDGVVSVEHEDALVTREVGIRDAVTLLQSLMTPET